jgi:hypothetical protein
VAATADHGHGGGSQRTVAIAAAGGCNGAVTAHLFALTR